MLSTVERRIEALEYGQAISAGHFDGGVILHSGFVGNGGKLAPSINNNSGFHVEHLFLREE